MPGHVVAMGGSHPLLLEFALSLARQRPRVLYVPTAVGDDAAHVVAFYEDVARLDAEPDHLRLFGVPDDPCARVARADVILVNGGNTANMLAVWRVHGVDRALREAWLRGAVLCGASAGANCWFECSVTDSYGPALRALHDGLALLAGSFCPHYDGEPERRPAFTRLVGDGTLPPGLACDDGAAAWFEGATLREAVAGTPAARGYRVTPGSELVLEARLLG